MLQELQQRFKYATDPACIKFEQLFVTATILGCRNILTDAQTGSLLVEAMQTN